MFCLLVLLSLGANLPTHADGYWNLHVDVVKAPSATPAPAGGQITWTAPDDAHNTISLPSLTVSRKGSVGPGHTGTYSQTFGLTVKITGTWMGTDPAPSSVEIIEAGKAHWGSIISSPADTATGDASDGLDPVDSKTHSGISQTPTVDANGTTLAPPAHLTTENGSTWSVTRDFSATSTVTLSPPATPNRPDVWNCSVALDSYTLTVHAQPYGWYCAGWDEANGAHHDGPKISSGVITFVWGWKSTSGNLADLAGITIYETVDYSGNPGTFSADNTLFYPKSPPVQAGYHVPNGKAGSPIDATKLYAGDVHSPFPVISADAITFTVPQKYRFDDPTTNDNNILLYDCGNIVEGNFLNPSRWDTTELSYTAHTYYY